MKYALLVAFVLALKTSVAAASTTLTGTLTGHDGRPMTRGDVHLVLPGVDAPTVSSAAARDGRFLLRTDRRGLVYAHFTGVDHVRQIVALYLRGSDEIALDVRLRGYDYRAVFDDVRVIGDFNQFSRDNARRMVRRADGTFFAEIPVTSSSVAYQLLGLTESGASINGTQSETYEYDGGGDYRSVIRVTWSRAQIVFDPKRLRRSNASARVQFQAADGFASRFARIHDDMMRRRDEVTAARHAHIKRGKPAFSFAYDFSADMRQLARAIDSEKNRVLRQAYLIAYLDLGLTADGAELSQAMAKKALEELEPTSTLWSIEPSLLATALRYSRSEARYAAYVARVIESHPNPWTRRVAEKTSSPKRRVMPGKPVPTFTVSSFNAPSVIYTPAALRGKVYMIDFWATYCAPCLEELPNLNRVYAKYKARGLEILSVSLDEERATVERFRNSGRKMPWLNAILAGGSGHPMVKDFEIIGIPRAILVNRQGVIVATDSELRGRNLDRTIARVIGAD
jgi:thiol-disulfide isomerase/thioredoxin